MMVANVRLFEIVDGLLAEVPPEEAEKRREGRRHRSMSFVADVLFTPEEEAARDAEEAADAARRQAEAEALAADEADRRAAVDKLFALGLTTKEIKALIK